MPDVEIGSVPFQEAIDSFRSKLDIPSEHWDELRGDVNAKAFTVAGATKADLLSDLRTAVDKAISEGKSIGEFRKDFDQAVQRHGWSYKGKRGWRSRVIYDNNLRTARMAGRWEQIQRVKERRPYLQYLTVGDDRVRPLHRTWDERVLPVDDPWWDTHYPPNGWGCRCTVRTLSDAQVQRMGLQVDESPPVETTERVNTNTGEVYGEVPVGIDVGWDHNVGKAWLGPDIALGQRLPTLSRPLRQRALQEAQARAPQLDRTFSTWTDDLAQRSQPNGEIKPAGYLAPRVFEELTRRGHSPISASMAIDDSRALQILNIAGRDHLAALPSSMTRARAVLWDTQEVRLFYLLGQEGDNQIVAVRVRVPSGDRGGVINEVDGVEAATPEAFSDRRYKVLDGEL